MNFKHLSVILLLILVLFSISAVSAGNETVVGNSTGDFANATNHVAVDNATYASNVSGASFNGNIAYSNASASANVVAPVLQIALVPDEDSPLNYYLDVSIGDGENSADINNKNYFFSFDSQVKDDTPVKTSNNNNLIDVILFNRNNAYALNVNLLNKAHQEVNLTAPNFLWDFINKLISAFFSLFK